MKMDFKKMQSCEDRFARMLAILETQREEIARQKDRLRGNTELDGVIASVTMTEKRIDELMISVRQMKETASKVRELYQTGENNVVNTIDSGVRTKSGFRLNAAIVDHSQVILNFR
ncbi:hypothetical protein [Ruminococcus sp.]|uniref:hypothetical protein n=1 Tax=Ruminococcus sp. TaxID=41978 RepID=UPI00388EB7D6